MSDKPQRRFITGLDLGQSRDYTAIAVLERLPAEASESKPKDRYAVRHLKRLPLGTSYAAVCDHLIELFAKPPLTGTMLAVDETGVGRPVVDLLDTSRIQADIRPITITGGHEAHRGERMGWKVPKKCLVSTMQVLLQGRRLTVAKSLAFAPVLVEELVAVGTALSSRPPHRSGRAAFPHPALTSGVWRRIARWDSHAGFSERE